MTAPGGVWHLIVPGPLTQRTGGFIYDAEVVRHARMAGETVRVHEPDAPFPGPDPRCAEALSATLDAIPRGEPVVLDGLAAGAHPDVFQRDAGAHPLIALVHHPLGDETGLTPAEAATAHERELDGLAAARGVLTSSAYTIRRLEALAARHGRVLPPLRAAPPGAHRPREWIPPAVRGRASGAPPVLLCLATVTPRKGQTVLVEALRRIAATPWQCELIGSTGRDPGYARQVRETVRAAGLTDRVRLHGEVDDEAVQRAWARADVLVLPSYYEGYGMVLADARVRGIPIATTTGGAIPDTVAGSPTEQVPPGDADALAARLQARLRSPETLHAWQEAAREDAGTPPGWSDCARTFLHVLREFARCPKRSTPTG